MERRRAAGAGLAVLTAAMVLALCPPGRSGEATTRSAPIRIGLINTLFRGTPESLLALVSRPLQALMESQTGMTGNLVSGGDADSLGRQLKENKFQLGVFHGVEFAWARQKYPNLKPLVLAVNHNARLHACVVVRQESDAKGLADLRDKSVALPRLTREHCTLYLERRCQSCGLPLKKYFEKVTTPTDAEDALDDVVDANVQATVVDEVAFQLYQQAKPCRAAKLKVAQQSETFPAAVVVYHQPGPLDEDTLGRFREGLLKAHLNPRGQQLLAMCRITAFEKIPEDYEQMLLEISKAYPPPSTITAGK